MKEILSNDDIDISLRYLVARKFAQLSENENSILFLIANEISKAFLADIKPLDSGYLIYYEDSWAVFVEHGEDLLKSQRTSLIVNYLSRNFENVLLASCDSEKIANNFENIVGFEGDVSVQQVVIFLISVMNFQESYIRNLLKSKLSEYQLLVTEDISGKDFIAIAPKQDECFRQCAWKNYNLLSTLSYSGSISLYPGFELSWGATHINRKCRTQGKPITDSVLDEILCRSDCGIKVFFDLISLSYKVVIVILNPNTAPEWYVAAMLVGPQLLTFEGLTILSADLWLKKGDGVPEPTLSEAFSREFNRWIAGGILVYELFPPDTSKKRRTVPFEMLGCAAAYQAGQEAFVNEHAKELAAFFISGILLGFGLTVMIWTLNGEITTLVGENTLLYYLCWVVTVYVILALIVATIALLYLTFTFPPILVIELPVLACMIFGAGIFIDHQSSGFSIQSIDEDMKYIGEDDYDSQSYNFDDDNDGIVNAIEILYYELYIEEGLEGPYYIGEGGLGGNPSTINSSTWMDPYYDYDNDGLVTFTEIVHDSNPFVADTDEDTLLDSEEIVVSEAVHSITATLTDSDFDGVLDTQTVPSQGQITHVSNPMFFDTDHDGLSDKDENDIEGCDVYDPDSDGDTLLDGWEVYANFYGWNSNPIDDIEVLNPEEVPTDPANWAELDIDDDGLTNTEESIYFTDPRNSDTDGDGLDDNWEVCHNFDPTDETDGLFDHDNDGIVTGIEYSVYSTYWNYNDSDSDGLLDGDEVNTYNSNPLDSDSDSDNIDDFEEVNEGIDGYLTNPNNDDTDYDGLTDDEEIDVYFTNPTIIDSDGDGLTDGDEIILYSTDPTNSDTDGDSIIDSDELWFYLTDPTNSDTDFDGLEDWDELSIYFTDPLDDDMDNDGLLDGYEILTLGTDPDDDDSDNDSILDGEEVILGLDGYITDPLDDDSDSDGLNDAEEINTYDTNPTDSDTDNDGWIDGYEVGTTGTNPKKADTDSDGIKDKVEFNYWKSRGKSNATAYAYCKNDDIDNDGLEDGDELLNGSDPLDNDSDNDGILDGLEVNNYHTDPDDPDSDNDGYDDLTEIINGTDPNDSSDYPGAGGGGFGW